jgi:hypothetical protein
MIKNIFIGELFKKQDQKNVFKYKIPWKRNGILFILILKFWQFIWFKVFLIIKKNDDKNWL